MLTFCNRSAIGAIKASPGPLVSGQTRPKRNTTPRSYCLMIRTLDPVTAMAMATTAISTTMVIISVLRLSSIGPGRSESRRSPRPASR
jgi:hypothetical protein